MSKSHVSMERHVCIVCGKLFDTGSILLDRRLCDSLERSTITGTGLCPEHLKLFDDGYIALVEVANKQNSTTLKPQDADRTGRIAHVRRTVATEIFNAALPDGAMVYVEAGTDDVKGVIDMLEDMQHQEDIPQ